MPMQESTAKTVWLTAIAEVTSREVSSINAKDKWTVYMSDTQLEAAYDATNAALAAHQWSCSWKLLEVAQCDTVETQYKLLAAKAKYQPPESSALHLAVAKATKPLLGKVSRP